MGCYCKSGLHDAPQSSEREVDSEQVEFVANYNVCR